MGMDAFSRSSVTTAALEEFWCPESVQVWPPQDAILHQHAALPNESGPTQPIGHPQPARPAIPPD